MNRHFKDLRLAWRFLLLLAFVHLSAFICSHALADGAVSSDFVFQLSDDIFASPEFNLASTLQGQVPFTIPNTVLNEIAPVAVTGISGLAAYDLTPTSPHIVLGAGLGLVSSHFSVSLTIQSVSVNTVINTVEGGTTISTPVNGSCANIPLQLADGAGQVTGTLVVGIDASGLPTITPSQFAAHWAPGAWSIGAFTCTGYSGFQEQVAQGIQNYLSNSSMFNSQIQTMVTNQAALFQAQIRATFLQPRVVVPNVGGVSVTMVPSHLLNVGPSQFQMAGTLQFAFPSAQQFSPIGVTAAAAPPATVPGYALLVPSQLWTALHTMAFQTGMEQYQELGSQIAAFQSFLGNWFEEFFVWPQLLAYSSGSAFQFLFEPSSLPGLSAFTDNGDGTLSQAFAASLDAVTLAPLGKTKTMPMVTFHAPMQGAAVLSIGNSGGTRSLNVQVYQLAMQNGAQLTGTWDTDYVNKYSPDQYINYGLIQSNAVSGIVNTTFSTTLGQLPITQSLTLTPASLQMQGASWIQVNWD